MDTYCGANCESCPSRADCRGCCATGGSPFGGRCVAAERIRAAGREAYAAFKEALRGEINALLAAEGIPAAERLFELRGYYVNLPFPTPGGGEVKFLNDRDVYLGAQIELKEPGRCCGVAADDTFILICRYGAGGSEPELVLFKKR